MENNAGFACSNVMYGYRRQYGQYVFGRVSSVRDQKGRFRVRCVVVCGGSSGSDGNGGGYRIQAGMESLQSGMMLGRMLTQSQQSQC